MRQEINNIEIKIKKIQNSDELMDIAIEIHKIIDKLRNRYIEINLYSKDDDEILWLNSEFEERLECLLFQHK